ncbi:MAG: transglutaminase domain-containing protein [Intestinibaculum porci]|uniref:transglutaminase domain-containing protein n=1 Tax=Intestinibaculum porci TaxID=2487118 RepID=UPI0024090274|nr:transglutaminase domain-containing protein [Intestinibaculum porci]MDD6423661.1 transglutaminase domain-containing protein [Intestinibaculum porci]
MKNKTKEIHNSIMKIGAAILALAVAAGASTPAITSFTQAQPVTKTKKKAKAKAKTTVLKTLTLIKGKSKTVSVKTKSKVRWTSSNAKVASVKSISKSKVKITAKKEGNAKVSGKAGSAKWSFSVKVNPNGDFYFKADQVPNTIKFFWPGTATNDERTIQYNSSASDGTYDPVDVEGANQNKISANVSDHNQVKCTSSDSSILKVYKPNFEEYSKIYATYYLIPYKAGTVTLTMTYPGGSYKKKVTVKPSAVYEKIKNIVPAVKNSGLDDAHKAYVLAAWMYKNTTYGYNKSEGLYGFFVEGRGVCDDYANAYEWLTSLVGIESRTVESKEHAWNQVKLNSKWYNADVTGSSEGYKEENYSDHFIGFVSDNVIKDYGVRSFYDGNVKNHVSATSNDYKDYDWGVFEQTDQFKQLISL